MTSANNSSLIDQDDPLGLTKLDNSPEAQAWREHLEQVRQRLAASYSSSPLHQARAEKDPTYWQTLWPGGIY